jgi:integrase
MPRLRLTAQHVESLPAIGGRRTDYFDVIVPELALRVTPTGSRSWAVLLKAGHGRGGRRTLRVTLGKVSRLSLAQAREEARAVLDRTSKGEPPAPARTLSVDGLVRRALAALHLSPKTRVEWERLARVEIGPALGTRPAADLQRADVRAWTREVGKRSGWTANRAFEVLRRCYSWAVYEEELFGQAGRSPCERMPKPFDEPRSERVLSLDELRRLLGALDRLWERPYADATLLLLLTGVRRDSVVGLKRAELQGLEGEDPRWVIPPERSKHGRPHVVPLSPAAAATVRRRIDVVDELLGEATQHLFPAGGDQAGLDEPMLWSSTWIEDLREEMRPVTDETTLGPPDPRWTIHSLRHTLATHLIEDLGVSRHVVSLILGHTLPGPAATRVYDRADLLPERRAALERWAEWLRRLAEDQAAPAAAAKILPHRRR